ncbi:Fpg/Nei family DNA glycosylase [Sandaracinus amylolyticus]|uniref:Fpg/Nei family DNA glycosylase n=1 Tax=Sandaracinus amylolyticus TaxID=927083 RepID=UPI001F3B3871|nr:DNA-formamidopyrimidine glycosylase family protein [Sandaracinus amylolyticus]UJR83579.1 Hypothetical protein I5071_56470 [Sandaracinus amylolyticus]
MPELPEVEHARRQFLAVLGEHETILDARASDPIVVPMSHDAWRHALVGRRIEGASRIGKNLLVTLSGDHAMWFHLGMTGRLVRQGAKDEKIDEKTGLPRFTKWWIKTKRATLCLADARRLGRSLAGSRDEVMRGSKLDELGPDALSIDSADALHARLERAKGPIKAALMDQSRIAGLGNIQAIETLWRAKIHPETPVPALKSDAWKSLYDAMHESLDAGLASMRDTDEVVYVEAGGPNPFLVYDRESEPCPRCGTKLVREVTRGRSSYLCPKCQKKPRAK